jgi:hypothetical protein
LDAAAAIAQHQITLIWQDVQRTFARTEITTHWQ